MLDDNDIWSSVKVWTEHPDKILSLLANDLVNRKTFKVEIYDEPLPPSRLEDFRKQLSSRFGVSEEETSYLMSWNVVQKDMYDINDDKISILYKDGTCKDIAEASDLLNINLLSKKIRKYYLCYHRN